MMQYAEDLADKLEKQEIRVDIDDRTESIGKKIRDAELDWTPLTVVLGEKEKQTKQFAVRMRETGKIENMNLEELVNHIKSRTKNMPYKSLPLPRLVTKRPVFIG
jgi:threonyl-tRNA synthetase